MDYVGKKDNRLNRPITRDELSDLEDRLINQGLGKNGPHVFDFLNPSYQEYVSNHDIESQDPAEIDQAIVLGIKEAENNKANLNLPSGSLKYSSEFEISERCGIVGEGSGRTFLRPDANYSGWCLTLNDTWYNASYPLLGMSIDSTTFDPKIVRFGNALKGFSILGDNLNEPVQQGIRTFDRVDKLLVFDVCAFYLNGQGLDLGTHGTEGNNKGLIRESEFYSVMVRGCGTSTLPPWQIGTGEDVGDGSNNIDLYSFRSVHNHSSARIYGTTKQTRRIRFLNMMLHGSNMHESAFEGHLINVEGLVRDIQFIGLKTNGSQDVNGQKYGTINVGSLAEQTPADIKIDADHRNCAGHGVVVNAANRIKIEGSVDSGSIDGNEVRFEAGSITSNGSYYAVEGNSVTSSAYVDPGLAGLVGGAPSRQTL